MQVETAKAVRTEQPLVTDRHQGIGLQRGHVDRQRAQRLAGVDHERRTHLAQRCTDGVEVEHAAVGPVHVGDGGENDPIVDAVEHRLGPRLPGLFLYDGKLRAGLLGEPLPRVVVGRELTRQHQHAVTRTRLHVASVSGKPIARRRDRRDAVGVGIHQLRESLPQPLDIRKPVLRVQLPRPPAPIESGRRCGMHTAQQRGDSRRVEVRDRVVDQELVSLVREDVGIEVGAHPEDAATEPSSLLRWSDLLRR
jgi:hypothetical protein